MAETSMVNLKTVAEEYDRTVAKSTEYGYGSKKYINNSRMFKSLRSERKHVCTTVVFPD